MERIFGPGGILSRSLPQHELRQDQQKMASAIASLLASPGGTTADGQDAGLAACLMVEAETGLGKTLAYLAPAALSGRRTVVSTHTRHLQDQILGSEVPFLRRHVAPELRAMCVKGRQNYLCLYRWHQLGAGGQRELFAGLAEAGTAAAVEAWLKKTVFADRAELPGLASSSALWQKICCLPHFCLGSECPEGSRCYLNRVRREAAACQLLVVNHHLLFSDLAVRRSGFGEVLPRYDSVIFDEAHHLEDVAATFFGFSFSRYQLLDLIADADQTAWEQGSQRQYRKIVSALEGIAGLGERFFSLFPVRRGRLPLSGLLADLPELLPARDALLAAMDDLACELEHASSQDGGPWEQHRLRCLEAAEALEKTVSVSSAEQSGYVHWFERSEKNLSLSATPVDVAADLRSALLANVRHCVFTSATLKTGSEFAYFSARLGIPEGTPACSFPSPFDYESRTLLYVPDDGFPEPNGPGYRERLHREVRQLLVCSRGRALVLFTSFQAMELAWHSLRDVVDYPLLRQGSASRQQLLARFAEETDSVLLAVASFWEGVDVPGESLSMVVIDKLPFEVPDDPVLLARIERIRASGGNPFLDLQVPRAILGLRQGAGRLMRRSEDRGVIAILDVRLFSKSYGKKFLAGLPPSPLSRAMRDVKNFFADESSSTCNHAEGMKT